MALLWLNIHFGIIGTVLVFPKNPKEVQTSIHYNRLYSLLPYCIYSPTTNHTLSKHALVICHSFIEHNTLPFLYLWKVIINNSIFLLSNL